MEIVLYAANYSTFPPDLKKDRLVQKNVKQRYYLIFAQSNSRKQGLIGNGKGNFLSMKI